MPLSKEPENGGSDADEVVSASPRPSVGCPRLARQRAVFGGQIFEGGQWRDEDDSVWGSEVRVLDGPSFTEG